MALLQSAKTYLAKNVARLPEPLGGPLLQLNRNPDRVFGKAYRRHRAFLRANYPAFDNVPHLLKAANRAISEVGYYRDLYRGRLLGSRAEFEEVVGFIDKDTVLSNYDRFKNSVIDLTDYDVGTTGGTSGKPLTFIAPKSRYGVELATMHSLWGNAGYDFDVRAVIRNHRLPEGRDYVINALTKEVIFDGFRLTADYFATIYRTIRRLGIRFIHCYPSTAYEFSTYLHREELDIRCISAFLSGSENIFDYQRELIQDRLGLRFYTWYGHSEKLVLAGQCAASDAYHVEPSYGYFELIDGSGRVIREPGGFGEIVGTSFYNVGMPFVRYRTGDYAEYVGDYCAECRRQLPIIRNIRGRWSGDRLFNGDGTFVTTTSLNLHSDLNAAINGLQYLQERMGEVTILIVKSPQYTARHEGLLRRHFADRFNRDTHITLRYTDHLQRKPNGKFVQLISNVAERAAC